MVFEQVFSASELLREIRNCCNRPGHPANHIDFRAGLFGIRTPAGDSELLQQTWAPNHPHMVFEQVSPIFLIY